MFNKIRKLFRPIYRYHYFVSYDFNTKTSSGNGMVTMCVKVPVTTMEQVLDIKDWLMEEDSEMISLVVRNYIFLRKERH